MPPNLQLPTVRTGPPPTVWRTISQCCQKEKYLIYIPVTHWWKWTSHFFNEPGLPADIPAWHTDNPNHLAVYIRLAEVVDVINYFGFTHPQTNPAHHYVHTFTLSTSHTLQRPHSVYKHWHQESRNRSFTFRLHCIWLYITLSKHYYLLQHYVIIEYFLYSARFIFFIYKL